MTPVAPAPLALYLIRHGQTAWSLSGRHTGSTDLVLTAEGEREARALAPFLDRVHFSHVLTSPLRRARQTCAMTGCDHAEVEPDLAEWDYGDYEGERSADIHRTRPGWDVFRDGCPGGESAADVLDRADRLIGRLSAMSGNVALFSHGQFGPALAARWIGLPVAMGRHFPLATASLNILGYSATHPDVRVIRLWNMTPEHCAAPLASAAVGVE